MFYFLCFPSLDECSKDEKEISNQKRKKGNRAEQNNKEKHERKVETSRAPAIPEGEDYTSRRTVNENEIENNLKNDSKIREKARRPKCDTNGDFLIQDVFINGSKMSDNGCEVESDNEILEELKYNYDSEEDFDIPTEENFLKSSTSVSGDDDVIETSFGRPRSVHFEDEKWENGEYRIREDREVELMDSWDHVPQAKRADHQEGVPFSGMGRLSNIKSANTESVREIFRRKREEVGDSAEQDGRRRIPSNERGRTDSQERKGRSRSKEKSPGDSDRGRKPVSVSNGGDPERKPLSRSRSPKKENGFARGGVTLVPVNGNAFNAGVIISRRDYAMFKSLVDSQMISNSKPDKPRKLGPPKSGGQKR